MAVDGIGGGKPPFGVGGPAAPKAASSGSVESGNAGAFKVQTEATAPTALSDAERLQRGELTPEQYLDARVQQAVQHLEGVVPEEHLQLIKEQLLEQLQGNDPVVATLLQRATAAASPPAVE